MWVGDEDEDPPTCTDAVDAEFWVEITNPDNMDIFAFNVDNSQSYGRVIQEDGANSLCHKVRKIRMNLQGRLVIDSNIQREVEDVINVRNDIMDRMDVTTCETGYTS